MVWKICPDCGGQVDQYGTCLRSHSDYPGRCHEKSHNEHCNETGHSIPKSKQIKEWAKEADRLMVHKGDWEFKERVLLILADIIDRLESIEYPYGRRKNA